MINALNSQNYQTTYTQNSTQKSSAVSFSEKFNETHKNKNLVLFLSDEFKSKVYHQSSQTYKFNKEISQSKYENSISFIINKMQGILEKMSNDKQAYEMANSFYKGFLLIINPEQLVLKEIQANEFKITDIQAPKSVFVETYKNQSVEALKNKNYKAKEYLAKLEESLGRYEASLKHITTHSMTFFSTFQSEFSESEMQEIIDELATIQAYNDYKAHNISLTDGSTISWSYDKNGNMLVKINEFDINTALENADKALTEMENFKTLLEMFKQRENLNGLESGLNSEKLHSNSHSNLTNSSENLGKNSNLQANYTINTPRKQVSFREGVSYEFEYPQNANTPFLSAVSAAQPAVSESEYNQALSRIKDLMDEIVSFVISEQGADSELGFNLDQMDKHFTAQMESNSVKLDMLKSQIKNYNGDDKLIINTMQSYFAFGGQTATHYIAKFFDYASDKIENLPVAQIVQDLSIVKGYWDNNTEQGFVIEGKKLSLSQIFNEKTKRYQTKLNIDNIEFSDINFNSTSDKFESKKFEILLGIFEKREKISVQNSNANSNDSFLKELLKSV